MTGPVLLAGDRQLEHGKHVLGLFLVVWGGLFAGMPVASFLFGLGQASGKGVIGFTLAGIPVFLLGLYLTLQRVEIWLSPVTDSIEQRRSFLGRSAVYRTPRKLFDAVYLAAQYVNEDTRKYRIALQGAGGVAELSLGEFDERKPALCAGVRAARRAGLAFEEKPEAGPLLRMEAAEVARVPMAELPQEEPWWRRPSVLALIAANLVPLAGVLFARWEILPVMLLFWVENVIIGGYTLVKIVLARGGEEFSVLRTLGNLGMGAFFTFHYGMFCFVHGIFVVALFGGRDAFGKAGPLNLPAIVLQLALEHGLVLALLALIASHGFSLYAHYLRPRAYEEAVAGKIMAEPYKRVVILHVVVLGGGFVAQVAGSGLAPLALLVLLKTAVDLASHAREHALPHERELLDFMALHGHAYLKHPAVRA